MQHTLQRWREEGKYIDFKKYKIFYKFSAKPNAQTIFLIHGYPTSSFDWSKIWNQLADQYQIVAIDLLGLGFSDKPHKYSYCVQDHADQCMGLIEHLNLKHVHLIGHDMGVGIIQELLDRQQNAGLSFSIDSAIFMNGSLFAEVYRPRLIQKLMGSSVGHCINFFLSYRLFSKNMKNMFDQNHQPSALELEQWYKQLNINNGKKCLVQLNRSIFDRFKHRDRLVGALINSSIPMLLINGKNDPNSGEHMAKRYKEIIPHPQVVEIENCGHWTPWEQPDIVRNEIENFLSTIPMRKLM